MKKYFILQLKRCAKILPAVILVAAILFSCLSVIFASFLESEENSEENTKFKIAIVGNAEEEYFDLGFAAVQSLDSTRFALELVRMDEQEAKKELEKGEISAYVVVPEDFIDAAFEGKMLTLSFVTGVGSTGLLPMFKEELTAVISTLVEESRMGAYGVYDAVYDNSTRNKASEEMNKINIRYVDFVFRRSNLYKVTELGISDGLGLAEYLFCAFSVLFLFLLTVTFGHLYIKPNLSMQRILKSRRLSSTGQVLTEFCAYLVSFLSLAAVVCLLVFVFDTTNLIELPFEIGAYGSGVFVISLLVAAFSFFIFEISSNLIGGLLTLFFGSVILCYISGCLYPVYMLPVILQKTADFLPTGICRVVLSGIVQGEASAFATLGLLLYVVIFLALSVFVRSLRIESKGELL